MNENDPYRYVGKGGGTVYSSGGKSSLEILWERFTLAANRLIAAEKKIEALEAKVATLEKSLQNEEITK